MVCSYCMDNENRLISICLDDLTGTSDWYRGDIGLTPNDTLWDEHGAALYKIVLGTAVERDIEERKKDWPAPVEPEASIEDYREALTRLGVTL